MGIMVYSLSWVVQDFVHQPQLSERLHAHVIGCRHGTGHHALMCVLSEFPFTVTLQ